MSVVWRLFNNQSMGRSGKKQESSSQSEAAFEEDEDEALMGSYLQPEEDQHHQHVLASITQNISSSKKGEQLTWTALYTLKKKQIQLNEELKEQIQSVKNKYELLKQPIYKQISAVALGKKVADALYKPEGLACQSKIKKMAPKKIESFWGIIFDKEDILTEQIDVECFGKIKEFNCEIIDLKTNRLKITFKFLSETQYFSNLQLALDIWYDAEAGPIRTIKQQIAYKKLRVDNSVFTLLFDASTDIQVCYNFASEIYQDYSNALYFYFREEDGGWQSQNKSEQQNPQRSKGEEAHKDNGSNIGDQLKFNVL